MTRPAICEPGMLGGHSNDAERGVRGLPGDGGGDRFGDDTRKRKQLTCGPGLSAGKERREAAASVLGYSARTGRVERREAMLGQARKWAAQWREGTRVERVRRQRGWLG